MHLSLAGINPKRDMFHSIRWKLTLSYVLLTLMTVSATGILALEIVRRYALKQELLALQANAGAISEQAIPYLASETPSPELHRLIQAASFLGDARVRILDRQGKVIADSGQPGSGDEVIIVLPAPENNLPRSQGQIWPDVQVWPRLGSILSNVRELPAIRQFIPDSSWKIIRRYSGPWGGQLTFAEIQRSDSPPDIVKQLEVLQTARSRLVVRHPIGGAQSPLGYVELSGGPDYVAAALRTTQRAFLLAGAGATFLAVVIGLLMSQRLTSPLRRLEEAAIRMGSGDLSTRAAITSRDEIGSLATQFNRMAEQLQSFFTQLQNERDSLRRFISDASHELRTPITALKNFILLLTGPAGGEPSTRVEFLAESQMQIERLEWITRNLLDLSRLEAGLVDLQLAKHDVGDILEAVAASFKARAKEKGIELRLVNPASPRRLMCDQLRLELALGNLLDNAIKFTPAGGKVEIGAQEDNGSLSIYVEDNGPGIAQDDLPHIFERFYRGKGAAGTTGSGLGLAIAKRLIEAQGGRISVTSIVGQGTRFALSWE